MLELGQEDGGLVLRGNEYELAVAQREPHRATLRVRGGEACTFWIAGTCDADGRRDGIAKVGPAEARHHDEAIELVIPATSDLWGALEYRLRATAGALEHYAVRRGRRRLDGLAFLATRDRSNNPALATARWRRVFDPEPNARRKHYFATDERATIGVSSDRTYHRGNWLFTPGPLCYSLHLADDNWLAAGIAAQPGQNNFDDFTYRGSADGCALELDYGGHTISAERWESPHLVFLPGGDEYGALAAYCDWLRAGRLVPTGQGAQHEWWWQPIACGWGEQVNMERRTSLASLPAVIASQYCTQENYERFFTTLEARGIRPGTIVIDDKWQEHYGGNTADHQKWPDLRGFVARQHAAGRRVLLWLHAWHPEGVPAPECIVDERGESLAVDPSSSPYQARLRSQVRHMLSDLDADGFKIDFSHCLPRDRQVSAANNIWGVELLRQLVQTIHDEAKTVKADALIMTHTANPYFADVVDMLRLNDIANIVGEPSYLASMVQRQRVAKLASPHWIIDTDNWPSPNRAAWREYLAAQPALGVPSLYYVSRVYYLGEDGSVSNETLRDEDYIAIADCWAEYRRGRPAA